MPGRSAEELRAIAALSDQIEAVIARAGVDRQIAIDATEHTLARLVCEVFDNEPAISVYAGWFCEHARGLWRRWNTV